MRLKKVDESLKIIHELSNISPQYITPNTIRKLIKYNKIEEALAYLNTAESNPNLTDNDARDFAKLLIKLNKNQAATSLLSKHYLNILDRLKTRKFKLFEENSLFGILTTLEKIGELDKRNELIQETLSNKFYDSLDLIDFLRSSLRKKRIDTKEILQVLEKVDATISVNDVKLLYNVGALYELIEQPQKAKGYYEKVMNSKDIRLHRKYIKLASTALKKLKF